MSKIIEWFLILIGKLILFREGDTIVIDIGHSAMACETLKKLGYRVLVVNDPSKDFTIIREVKE